MLRNLYQVSSDICSKTVFCCSGLSFHSPNVFQIVMFNLMKSNLLVHSFINNAFDVKTKKSSNPRSQSSRFRFQVDA